MEFERADLRKNPTKTRLSVPLSKLPCLVKGASLEEDRLASRPSTECDRAKYGERDNAVRSWVVAAKYMATPGTFL
jgi:hypothetical protein